MKKALTLILLILVFNLTRCARIGSPQGGSKDSIPPVMAIAKPMNKTTSFNKKKIVILFNEYIAFKDLNSQLIISPPMDKKPIIKPQGSASKKISIEFLDSLTPNTTYTLNFGNSIVDHNEGNELGRFSYVFSTGKKLDSLSFSGKTLDPLTNKEVEKISIMAYKNANDTLVGYYKPNYLTNTLKGNQFILENLAEANYKIIALEDKNNNYQYDKGFERIGFLNQEFLINKSIDSIEFTLFKEPKNNKTFRPKQTKGNQLIIGYQGKDKPTIELTGTTKDNYFISNQIGKDSINIWFKEIPIDSIYITTKQDTLINNFSYKIRELKKDTLLLNSEIGSILHPNDSLSITTNIPVYHINNDSIQLLENDSISIPYKIISENKKHKLTFDFKRTTNKNYTLLLKDHAFSDIFENKSHSKKIDISTQDIEEYGDIILHVTNPESINLIFQLIEKNSKKTITKISNKTTSISFTKLFPQDYNIRIIKDLNKNNKFDNGNYLSKQQPETVIKLKKTITLRANSEINENISIE